MRARIGYFDGIGNASELRENATADASEGARTVIPLKQEKPDFTRRQVLTLAVGSLLSFQIPCAYAYPEDQARYETRPGVIAWAREVSARTGLNERSILAVLSKARHVKTSKRLMEKASGDMAPVRDWRLYRRRFLTDERIKKGAKFMRRQAEWLTYAQERWGIPGSILTALLGIETLYGQSLGRFRVLDVLTTLSFDHERRSAFFREELAAYLVLCKKGHFNPVTQRGSYAGAVGMPQFMPTNILKYGVDLDSDGKIDLLHSAPDAIASTANLMYHFGWNKDVPLEWSCTCSASHAFDLDAGGIAANTTLQNLLDAGVEPLEAINAPATTRVLLIDLPQTDETGARDVMWFIGSENFVSLLKYNRSYFYAQSVAELAKAIEKELTEESERLFF